MVCTRSMLSVAVGGRCCSICVESCSLFFASAFGYRCIIWRSKSSRSSRKMTHSKAEQEVPKKEYTAKERERKILHVTFQSARTHKHSYSLKEIIKYPVLWFPNSSFFDHCIFILPACKACTCLLLQHKRQNW